jgi:hypothetical protein
MSTVHKKRNSFTQFKAQIMFKGKKREKRKGRGRE